MHYPGHSVNSNRKIKKDETLVNPYHDFGCRVLFPVRKEY